MKTGFISICKRAIPVLLFSFMASLSNPAAGQTDADAKTEGIRLYQEKKYIEALPYLNAPDAQKDPLVQSALGNMFSMGLGVDVNQEKAFDWYLKAAKQNNAMAQLYVAYMLEKDLASAKNDREAFNWYKKQPNRTYRTHNTNSALFTKKASAPESI